jgi:Tol biopolymer transport system component
MAPLLVFTGKKAPGWDVFVCDLAAGASRTLTDGGQACRPRFSPDGRTIAYVSHEADGKGDVWLMAADGNGKRRLTVRDATSDYSPAWSPDGRTIVFASSAETMYAREGRWALYTADAATGRVELLFDGPGRDVFPDWRE